MVDNGFEAVWIDLPGIRRPDAILVRDGKIVMIDIKTEKGTKKTVAVQRDTRDIKKSVREALEGKWARAKPLDTWPW